MSARLSVIVCTLDRYDLLEACLAHLARQNTPPAFEVIVVDNSDSEDGDPRIKEMVAEAGAGASGEFVYRHGRGPNLSTARNEGLRAARGALIAYVDDDLLMPPDWAATVADVLDRTGADCILGLVEPELLPGGADPDLALHFRRALPLGEDAPILPNRYGFTPGARTCNVVFRRVTTFGRGLDFDPAFGRSGGEDQDVFVRLAKAGPFKVVYSEEAVARELIPPERQNVGYLCRREFRGGQVFVRVLAKNGGWPGWATGLAHRTVGAAQWVVATARLARAPGSIDARIAQASAAGKVAWRRPDVPGPYR